MAAIDRGNRRGKTPSERGDEAHEVQRRLKQEAAERRKKALAVADARPSRPRRSR
jgi:capsid protein